MPDLIDLIRGWWKQILTVMLLALIAAGVILYLKPPQYLSTSTAVPANPYSADRSRVFNENIQLLYSTLGTTDDLDMIVGTGQLDTVYEAVTDAFNLYDHYKMGEKGDAARAKAVVLLKKYSRVMKTEYGELRVKVWDTDKRLAPQLADAIMNTIQNIHKNLQSAGNESVLNGLVLARKKLLAELDTINTPFFQGKLQQYDKLISEYQLMIDSKPPALVVVEKGTSPSWPDRPKKFQVLVLTAILGFVFGLFLALALERRKIIAP
jgi:LPS O-antigen subunit length determinant protein (WzzB/FepE family)